MTWKQLHATFCPEPARRPTYARALNIGCRTLHIGVTGILIGGHAFDVSVNSLRPVLWLVIASGTALIALDSWKSCDWIHQGWGVMLFLKLALLCSVPFLWEIRLPILLAVVTIASVESHMPARLRHYSFLYGRVMRT